MEKSEGKEGDRGGGQRPIDSYIVDFISQEVKLIIEIDGSSHIHKSNYDKYIQDSLENLGYHFLRFTEGEVLNSLDDVSRQIEHAVYFKGLDPPP